MHRRQSLSTQATTKPQEPGAAWLIDGLIDLVLINVLGSKYAGADAPPDEFEFEFEFEFIYSTSKRYVSR